MSSTVSVSLVLSWLFFHSWEISTTVPSMKFKCDKAQIKEKRDVASNDFLFLSWEETFPKTVKWASSYVYESGTSVQTVTGRVE